MARPEVSDQNLVVAADGPVLREFGPPAASYLVASPEALVERGVRADGLAALENAGLVIGIPRALLAEPLLFGGSLIAISDASDKKLGDLKLSKLGPLVARFEEDGSNLRVVRETLDDEDDEGLIFTLPTIKDEADQDHVLLDFSRVASELDYEEVVDIPSEKDVVETSVVRTDFSGETLVIDTVAKLKPAKSDETPDTAEGASDETVQLTIRWFLERASARRAADFRPRQTLPTIGYFDVPAGDMSLIERHALSSEGAPGPVHYYVKNVPERYHAGFAAGFEEWNEVFRELTGEPIFTYEFLAPDDARGALIVAGDSRYNVVEWDVDNVAPYNGTGPSFSRPDTGEMLASWILIQGPKVEAQVRAWFDAEARGEWASQAAPQPIDERDDVIPLPLTFPSGYGFEPPQREHDRVDFSPLTVAGIAPPAGLSFAAYMNEFFRQLLSHELGHNLGLTHNFRGSLVSPEEQEKGIVARSVMDYFGRGVRHLVHVGSYDRAAIAFGYGGITPDEPLEFCDDHDTNDPWVGYGSPECAMFDSSDDPYGNFRRTLAAATAWLIRPGEATTPPSRKDLENYLVENLNGMISYADGAYRHPDRWTHWQLPSEPRPHDPDGIKDMIWRDLDQIVCSATLLAQIDAKPEGVARDRAKDQHEWLIEKVREIDYDYEWPLAKLSCF